MCRGKPPINWVPRCEYRLLRDLVLTIWSWSQEWDLLADGISFPFLYLR